VTHQPAISFSISIQHPFNRAGGRTSNVIHKMTRFLLAAIFLSIQCVCAIEIRVPDSWSHVEVPSSQVPYQMPPTIRPMIRLVPPSKDGTASISEMKAIVSLNEAAKSYIRGMPMRGITIDSTADVIQNGLEGRHIKGHLSLAGREITFPFEAYILMAGDCILSVEVVSAEASSLINEVLSWIDFQAAVVPSKAPDANGASGRSLWEYLGIVVVLLAIGYAIFNSKRTSKKRSDNKP
jgi:hypothetical protein